MRYLLAFVTGFLLLGNLSAQGQDIEEYKSLFILRFTKYITWPQPADPIKIGILGNSKILPALTRLAKKQDANILVEKVDFVEEVKNFDMIVIPRSQQSNVRNIAPLVGSNSGIFVIAEEEFANDSITDICFFVENQKLKFVIFKDRSSNKGFRINQRLLNLATIR